MELQVEQVNELLTLDAQKGVFYWKNVSKFHRQLNGKIAGCSRSARGKEYWHIKIDGYPYKRGHLVYLVTHGELPHPVLDHINGNSLDDRPENLRVATIEQNAWNHHSRKKTQNIPMGIRLTSNQKYQARLRFRGKTLHLGTFDNLHDAHDAYINKRKELYGDFAGC